MRTKLLILSAILSFFIPAISYGAIAYDNATTSQVAGTSLTFPFTTSGSNRYLLLGINSLPSGDNITNATYGGVAMTRIAFINGSGNPSGSYLYYLVNPASGTNNVVVTGSGTTNIIATPISYTGVSQVAPEASSTASNSNSSTLSVSLSTVSDNAWVIGSFTNSANGGTAGTNTTQRFASGGQWPAIYESSLNPVSPTSSITLNVTGAGVNPAWDNRFIAISLAPAIAAPVSLSCRIRQIGLCH